MVFLIILNAIKNLRWWREGVLKFSNTIYFFISFTSFKLNTLDWTYYFSKVLLLIFSNVFWMSDNRRNHPCNIKVMCLVVVGDVNSHLGMDFNYLYWEMYTLKLIWFFLHTPCRKFLINCDKFLDLCFDLDSFELSSECQ